MSSNGQYGRFRNIGRKFKEAAIGKDMDHSWTELTYHTGLVDETRHYDKIKEPAEEKPEEDPKPSTSDS